MPAASAGAGLPISSCTQQRSFLTGTRTSWAALRSQPTTMSSGRSGWRTCKTRLVRSSGPFDSFLALRGLKTLDVRIERHCRNAAAIAPWLEWLEQDARVDTRSLSGAWRRTRNTTLAPNHRWTAYGGIVTFFIKGDIDERAPLSRNDCEVVRAWPKALAVSKVWSIIPAIMTHASVPAAEREKPSVSPTSSFASPSASKASRTSSPTSTWL